MRYALAAMPPEGAFPWERPSEALAAAEFELAYAATNSRLLEVVETQRDSQSKQDELRSLSKPFDVLEENSASDDNKSIKNILSRLGNPADVISTSLSSAKSMLLAMVREHDETPGRAELEACEQLEAIGRDCQRSSSARIELWDFRNGRKIGSWRNSICYQGSPKSGRNNNSYNCSGSGYPYI